MRTTQTGDGAAHPPRTEDSLVLSYLTLRTIVGAIGIALPFVLAIGKIVVDGPGLQNSMSDYYYTDMRNLFYSLALFRKTNPAQPPTEQRLKRNLVYTVCGYTILGCLAMLSGLMLIPGAAALQPLHPVFWLEAIAIVAFGVSWFTKGEAILKDDRPDSPQSVGGAPGNR